MAASASPDRMEGVIQESAQQSAQQPTPEPARKYTHSIIVLHRQYGRAREFCVELSKCKNAEGKNIFDEMPHIHWVFPQGIISIPIWTRRVVRLEPEWFMMDLLDIPNAREDLAHGVSGLSRILLFVGFESSW